MRGEFDTECNRVAFAYDTDTPRTIRAHLVSAKDSKCPITLRLSRAGVGFPRDVEPGTGGMTERKEIMAIEIRCQGGTGACKGRYELEFLD